MKNIWGIVAAGIIAGLFVNFYILNQIKEITEEVERVKVESTISSGKAIYMPGNVCIIRATSEIDADKMREFAAACIHSHRQWLLIKDKETTYLDDTEHKK